MEFLNSILSWLEGFTSTQVYIAIITALEFLMRFIKTDKPASVIHMIAGFIGKAGDVLKKVADILDKILPQRLK